MNLTEWIEKHIKVNWQHDPRHDIAIAYLTLRIPFYVTSRTVELDEKKIEKEHLQVYEKAGITKYMEKEAQQFKFGMSSVNGFIPNLALGEFEKKIQSVIQDGKLIEKIDGFCDGHLDGDSDECDGHECGTLIYELNGYCDCWPEKDAC